FHQLLDDGLQQELQSQQGPEAIQAIESLLGECFRGLRKLGMRDEINHLLERMAALMLKGQKGTAASSLGFKVAKKGAAAKDWSKTLTLLLHVAAGWFYFGQDNRARHILNEARDLLFEGDLPHQDQTPLACAYARTLGQAPVEFALNRLTELVRKVERVQDTYHTNSHFSLSRLRLVEAVVLALVSDDFTLDKAARRWLDEDEYLVRRRVHRDVRVAISQAGL